jgi:hypothetical protein
MDEMPPEVPAGPDILAHDPVYERLLADVERTYNRFLIAAHERKKVRDLLAVKRSPVLRVLDQYNRRPVGSPKGYRIPREPEKPPPPRPPVKLRKFYLGPILGWYQPVPAPTLPETPEPDYDLDLDKLFDRMSLRTYWRAKRDYEEALDALRDHTYGHKARATLRYAAKLQLLGGDDSTAMDELRTIVAQGCERAWKRYKQTPEPKTKASVAAVLHSLGDAQAVGLENDTVQSMQQETDDVLLSFGQPDMDDLRAEGAARAKRVWETYKKSPSPKSRAAMEALLEGLAEVEFLTVEDESVRAMKRELERLTHMGLLRARGQLVR